MKNLFLQFILLLVFIENHNYNIFLHFHDGNKLLT